MIAAYWEPTPPRPGSLDDCMARGFDTRRFAQASLPRLARCAHPMCRTSLTEDTAVQCPHGLTFCQHCTWEEACSECAA